MSSSQIRFGNEPGDSLLLEVQGREDADPTDFWEANWLAVQVTIRAGAFRGQLTETMWPEDFLGFKEGLEEIVAGRTTLVELQAFFHGLRVSLWIEQDGPIDVCGHIVDQPIDGNRLQFAFTMELSSLPALHRDVVAVCDRYPLIGVPPRYLWDTMEP